MPALLISTATGIVVRRAAAESNLGGQVFSRLILVHSRPLMGGASILFLFGAMPGLPKLAFLHACGSVMRVPGLYRRRKANG
ncbi:MAG: FHIPEP family type III secretion protein [Candidatus Manganitrophus sp.]|nr:MAG: FHIPEP family type III secretion protein [Candidatus Manganitrophus sp.]